MLSVMETEVIVVGAGPTGLVLACELALRGVAVEVVERQAAPTTITSVSMTESISRLSAENNPV